MRNIFIEGSVVDLALNEVDEEQGYILERHIHYYDAKVTLCSHWVIVSGKLNAEEATCTIDCYHSDKVIDIRVEPTETQLVCTRFFGE